MRCLPTSLLCYLSIYRYNIYILLYTYNIYDKWPIYRWFIILYQYLLQVVTFNRKGSNYQGVPTERLAHQRTAPSNRCSSCLWPWSTQTLDVSKMGDGYVFLAMGYTIVCLEVARLGSWVPKSDGLSRQKSSFSLPQTSGLSDNPRV